MRELLPRSVYIISDDSCQSFEDSRSWLADDEWAAGCERWLELYSRACVGV